MTTETMEIADPASSRNVAKTVLEMDLVAYSDVARMIEENLDVVAVKTFEDQVQSFVDTGLDAVGLKRDETVLGTAGDNAILLFDDAAVMHRFAEAVQAAAVRYNATKTTALAKRWFRMGAATGIVMMIPGERRIVGSTIARAVRLEAAAVKGQLVVDPTTFEVLPDDLRRLYSAEEVVKGKRDERFQARRCTFIQVPETDGDGHQAPPDDGSGRRGWIKAAVAGGLGVVVAGVVFAFVQFYASREPVSGPPTWEAELDATKVLYPNATGEQIWTRGVVLASADSRPLDTAIFAPFDNFGEIKRFTLVGRRLKKTDITPWLEKWNESVTGRTPAEMSQRFDVMLQTLLADGDEIGKVTRVLRADHKWDETVVGKGLSIVANGTTPHIGPLEGPIGSSSLLFVVIQLDCIPGPHPDMAGPNEDWLGHRFSWATHGSLALIDSTKGRPIETTSLRTIYRTPAGPADISTREVTRIADAHGIFVRFGPSEPNDYDRVTWAWSN